MRWRAGEAVTVEVGGWTQTSAPNSVASLGVSRRHFALVVGIMYPYYRLKMSSLIKNAISLLRYSRFV